LTIPIENDTFRLCNNLAATIVKRIIYDKNLINSVLNQPAKQLLPD